MNNFKNLATIYDIIKEMPVKDDEAEAKAIAHQNQHKATWSTWNS